MQGEQSKANEFGQRKEYMRRSNNDPEQKRIQLIMWKGTHDYIISHSRRNLPTPGLHRRRSRLSMRQALGKRPPWVAWTLGSIRYWPDVPSNVNKTQIHH